MEKSKALKIVKTILIILALSIIIEAGVVAYHFVINQLYQKFHFIGNETIEIAKEDFEIEEDEATQTITIKNPDGQKIYNVSLQMKDANQDVYLRILYNNDAKFMPKENADATKFKVYFPSGIETEEFSLNYAKSQIDIENIDKVLINDNIDYMPEITFSFVQMLIVFVVLTGIYGIYKLYKISQGTEKRIKKEWLFAGLALVIGVALVFVNAPQVRYDEHAHFWRAYEIASGNIISRTTNELPNSVIDLFRRADKSYPNKEIDYETIQEKIGEELNEDEKTPFAVGATGSLTPISYIPQVIGIFIGRILQLSPMIILYLGRLTNLLAYIAIVFFAIKIIPSEKWKMIIMMIALFPMSMNLAATVSPDTVIIGVSLLAIAYAMHLKFESKTITFKNIVLLGILCMIPTVCKVVYFPLCLLVFLLPKEKFESKSKKILSWIIVFAIVFIPYLGLNRIVALGDYEIAIRTNMTEQILFTLSSLPRDCLTALNTMYSEFSNYFFEMIGGWNTIQILSIILFIMLLITMFKKEENAKKLEFTKKDKIIFWIMIAIETLGVVAAMYLGWTQAKQTVVEGVQGRYLLPILPLLCILLSKGKFEWKIKNKEMKYAIILAVIYIIVCGFSIRSYM